MQSMMKHNETIIKNVARIELLYQKGFPFIHLTEPFTQLPSPPMAHVQYKYNT